VEHKLNEDEQKVWEILSTPYVPPYDMNDPAYIQKLIDEVKASFLAKQNEIR
jgi:hypothetical protein